MGAPATPNALDAGTVIARTYEIESKLGSGGMGVVYAARHVRTQKRVAIKILRDATGPEMFARFKQEAEIASKLGHPNIVRVTDFDVLPQGMAYLVMDLLEGESLRARAERGKVPVAEVLSIVRQIASALQAAHDAGVIHRDLKPENVFLVARDGGREPKVKVLDFGISKVLGSSAVRTREGVAMGTPRYMAPEQAAGRTTEIDHRVDQFALAVIAFELLAGEAPFAGDNATQAMFNIVNEPPRPLAPLAPETPPAVVAAIERALAKHPKERFADLRAFVAALAGRAAQDPGASSTQAVPATGGRGRTVALVAIVAALGIAATIWWFARDHAHATTPADAAVVIATPPPPVAIDAAVILSIDAPDIDAAEPPDAAPASKRPPGTGSATKPPPDPGMPDDIAAMVKDAKTALQSGRFSDASTLARRALGWGRIPSASIIMVEVACHEHDLASAHQWMRSLSRAMWPAARARCAAQDFPIENPQL